MHKCLGRVATGFQALAFALWLLSAVGGQAVASTPIQGNDHRLSHLAKARGKSPLAFEENRGQVDERVAFLARGVGFDIFLTHDGEAWLLSAPRENGEERRAFRMRALGGRERPTATGLDVGPGTASYFRGRDPEKWQRGLPTWGRVRLADVYPGVDWIFHPNDEQLEYDFVIAPGGDPATIQLAFDDPLHPTVPVKKKLGPDGSLEIELGGRTMCFAPPRLFQVGPDGQHEPIAGGYVVGADRVSFAVGTYDVQRPLVIDPILLHASYLGGNHDEWTESIAFDAEGNVYLSGWTFSSDFPTVGALQPTHGGTLDISVTKLNPTASEILFSTYIGGNSAERYSSIEAVADGLLVFIGEARSLDLPMVNSWDPTLDVVDVALFKLSLDGSAILFSTYFGGSGGDAAIINFGSSGYSDMSVDALGRIYIAGVSYSDDLPVTPNALQPTRSPGICGTLLCPDPFLAVFSPDGQTLVYSTYFGAPGDEWPMAVVADPAGGAYLFGMREPDAGLLPTLNAFQALPAGGIDLYVAKLPLDGSPPDFATYFGGSLDEWGGVTLDNHGNVIFAGRSNCADLPLLYSVSPSCTPTETDAFIARLNQRGTGLEFSSILVGSEFDALIGVDVDAAGNFALGGYTTSSDFPTVHPVFAPAGDLDALAAYLHATGPTLLFSTTYGGSLWEWGGVGIRDLDDSYWIFGAVSSQDLPLTPEAVQPIPGGSPSPVHAYDEGYYAAFQTLRAAIATPSRLPAQTGQTVDVPVTLAAGGLDLAALAFVLPIPACLDFDPADADLDGVPDDLMLAVPVAFSHQVVWNPVDHELGVAIYDASLPFERLRTGTLMTIRLTALCQPPSGMMDVSLPFASDPAPSFGLATGLDAPGDALAGSVRIFGGLRGDCNGSGTVNAADLTACVLEVFDTDGSFWLDAIHSTHAGSPFGCDANADTVIDAGDLACKALLVAGGSCSGARASGGLVELLLPPQLEGTGGEAIELPIRLETGGQGVRSIVFSLDLPDIVTFDPADSDGDGLPDAVASMLPPGSHVSAQLDSSRRYGELRIAIEPVPGSLADGTVLIITLQAAPTSTLVTGKLSFGLEPRASWGGTEGESLNGVASAQTSLTVLPSTSIFDDGFESGDASRWSGVIPAP